MHFTTSRVSLKKPEPWFGLVDWRERGRASNCAGSRGRVEGGLSELGIGRDVAIANLSGSPLFSRCIFRSYHPSIDNLRQGVPHWPERARAYRVDVVENLALRSVTTTLGTVTLTRNLRGVTPSVFNSPLAAQRWLNLYPNPIMGCDRVFAKRFRLTKYWG